MDLDAERAETKPVRPPRWGLGDALGGMVVGVVLSSLVAGVWLDATGQKELSLSGHAIAQLGLWVGLAGAVVLASRLKGAGSLAVDFGFSLRSSDILPGVVTGILCQVVLVPLVAILLSPLLGRPDVSGPTKALVQQADGVGLIGLAVFVFFVVVGAPVVEELFFRGLVMRSIERRLGATWAIALSGMLFGLAHLQDLPADALALAMISLAAVGAVFAILAVKTGRLGAGMVAHFTFNLYTVVVLLSGR
jgi:membrane protease YdiL (CAAX protease family)